jgi:hypothetical protein
MSRKVDIEFGPTEMLYRAIKPEALDARGKLKAQKLKLQISVARAKYGPPEACLNRNDPKANGVMEVDASDADNLQEGPARTVVVDEPLPNHEAHALIAIVAAPGSAPTDENLVHLRAVLAGRMRVCVPPTKI